MTTNPDGTGIISGAFVDLNWALATVFRIRALDVYRKNPDYIMFYYYIKTLGNVVGVKAFEIIVCKSTDSFTTGAY